MHFQQPPFAEMKMVFCLKGKIFDVAVDLRKKSKTYLQWYGQVLSSKNKLMMVIPEGFAHGYQSLTKKTEVLYATTSYYAPKYEAGVRFDDPMINIDWPIEYTDISEKDKNHPWMTKGFLGMVL
jgi:dTDP-4-dehydrorhamnose 3,5-epimerase